MVLQIDGGKQLGEDIEKHLELTNDSLGKLIEMCKRFYPEYLYIWRAGGITDTSTKDHICFQKMLDTKSVQYIHWLELCNNYLAPKLFVYSDVNPFAAYNLSRYYLEVAINKQNPIEILYKQYDSLYTF